MTDLTMSTPVRQLQRETARDADGTRDVVVLRDPQSSYRDGGEATVLRLVEQATDLSSTSDELISSAVDWPSRYHLDPSRANIVRGLSFPDNARVLEIGAGCGAVTRYLGEVSGSVDALEPVPSRAAVARARTRDLPNVEVFVGELSDLPPVAGYDVIVVVGVLEYVGGGTADLGPYLDFLRGIRARLVDGGTLVLAIENKLGVKYLVGAPEDHTNRTYDSLEGYPYGSHARTFSRSELQELLAAAGLTSSSHPVFPDYKMTRVVFGDLPESTRSLYYRVPQFPSPDWLTARPKQAVERRLWRTLVDARLEADFGNSFLVLAGNGKPSELWPSDAAGVFYSVGRRREFSAETVMKAADDTVRFHRAGLAGGTGGAVTSRIIESDYAFCDGEDLTDFLAENPDANLGEVLREWLAEVDAQIAAHGVAAMDLVPHNLVRRTDGRLSVIDIEFGGDNGERDRVIRRGIYWLAARVAPLSTPSRWPDMETIGDLARALGELVGLPADGSWLEQTIVEELQVQAAVRQAPQDASAHQAWLEGIEADLRRTLEMRFEQLPLGERDDPRRVQQYLDRAEVDRDAAREALAGAQAAADANQARVGELEAALGQLRAERAALDASRMMRGITAYRREVERLLPAGTKRRDAYGRALTVPGRSRAKLAGRKAALKAAAVGRLSLATSSMPTVSVVIPVHGKWDYTLRCLRSIAANPIRTPFEVIVVDDASPDDTLTKLAEIDGLRVVALKHNEGFVGATNAGIAAGAGEFVLLLNNDTEVHAGWLDALMSVGQRPDVGVVGARLVYPDGRLQEAGGVVFNDADGWNVGRLHNADDPRYNFVREVDYCSGAALLVRRTVLDVAGGLDTRYSPAYYEDTDLAFTARELGLRVMYQPRAVVVHHEGVSHGTDVNEGVKGYQVINREKFAQKWSRQLAAQPGHDGTLVPVAMWRGRLGLILIIDHYVPEPDRDSGSRRMVELIAILTDMGFGVVFLPDNGARSEPYTRDLQEAEVAVLYGGLPLKAILSEIVSAIRLAVVCRVTVAWRYIPMLREILPAGVPLAFDTIDLHWVREERQARFSGASEVTAASTRELELGTARACDVTFVVSPVERDIINQAAPEVHVEVLPNIHRAQVSAATPHGRHDLLFVGGFAHEPNIDAVTWFVDDVLPRILLVRPETRLTVVGSNPTPEILALASKHVDVVGWVRRLDPLYASARVVIAPLRFGAGIKGKVGEALGFGVPVVTTGVGAEGMGLIDGVTARIADDEQGIADAVLALLDDDGLWSELSAAGLTYVDEAFGGTTVRRVIEGLIPAAGPEHAVKRAAE